MFTAKANAIILALDYIKTMKQRNILIITDLKSCPQAMSSLKNDHPALVMIFINCLN